MGEGLDALLHAEGRQNGSALFGWCPPAVVERRDLVYFRDKKKTQKIKLSLHSFIHQEEN